MDDFETIFFFIGTAALVAGAWVEWSSRRISDKTKTRLELLEYRMDQVEGMMNQIASKVSEYE